MLELITFTGIDERTSKDGVLEVARRHRATEWGFLAGSATGKKPRYPPLATIDAWRDFTADNGLQTALHLCGRYSREIAAGRGNEHLQLCARFGRVQVNLPGAERYARIGAIAEFQAALGVPVILQHDDGWDSVPGEHDGIEYLFDRSGGRGLAPKRLCDHWPEPRADKRRYGYAGGIRIENADQAFAFANSHGDDCRTWLDMETHVRTDDHLDLGKVESICKLREQHFVADPST